MDEAIGLAHTHTAALVGVGVVDVPHLITAEAVPLGASAFKEERDAAALQAAHDRIDAVLATFRDHCRAAGLTGEALKFTGDPAELLSREAQRADLLVVGKKHAGVQEWERASRTLDQLVRVAPRPVLCVPVARLDGSPVVVAYDGSLQAARTLFAFVHSGLGAGRPIHLLAMGEAAHGHASLAADFLRAHNHAPELHSEPAAASVASHILGLTRQLEAGLIVMGSHGRLRLAEFFFGSVTNAVLRDTHVPLYLFH